MWVGKKIVIENFPTHILNNRNEDKMHTILTESKKLKVRSIMTL